MSTLKSIFITAGFLGTGGFLFGQSHSCGTDIVNRRFAEQNPGQVFHREQVQSLIDQASQTMSANGERSVYVIPTVVHILHKGGSENISNDQVYDALRVLNEDLRRISSDTGNTRAIFKPYAADFNLEFRLAKIDPQGNCTNGITNTYSSLTSAADDRVKRASSGGVNAWPVTRYFNIWVVDKINIDEANVIGYAMFPSWGASSEYGVVIDDSYFGTIGTAQGKDGRTLTHEVGHCLELYHTFQSGCGDNCGQSGDRICDTPPVTEASYSCNFSMNTCNNDMQGNSPYPSDMPDMVENYMSYNQGFCQNIFTLGQKARSDAALQNTFLAGLVTSSNRITTGTSDGFANVCPLVSDFKASRRLLCAGDSVKFTPMIQNGTPEVYTWTIENNGVEITTSENAPWVVFSSPGDYVVTLSVTNSLGTYTAVKQNYIKVHDTNGGTHDFFDAFNDNPLAGRWQSNNSPIGNGWEEKILTDGNQVVFINNVVNNSEGIISEIVSPTYDISGILSPKLAFKTAYAQKSASSLDRLRVYFSSNCGRSWGIRAIQEGANMASVPARSAAFEPAAGEWIQWEYSVPASMVGSTNLMIKFAFETGRGNNFYLDDINIVGIMSNDESTAATPVEVFPNPASDNFTLDLGAFTEKNMRISIYDMSGREIYSTRADGGMQRVFSVWDAGLASGMYRISVVGRKEFSSGKLMITK